MFQTMIMQLTSATTEWDRDQTHQVVRLTCLSRTW